MTLRAHIESQFPSLFITLVSILVGIFFADLVSEAQARMTLWPLDLGSLRTWGQIAAMGTTALSVWTIFAQVGISRRRVATLSDTILVFLAPVPLLIGVAFVGRAQIWPWFYFAAFYLAVAAVTTLLQTRLATSDPRLASFRILYRPLGHIGVIYAGVPLYLVIGWADQRGLLSPLVEAAVPWMGAPAPLLCVWLFIRDWHAAIAAADGENSAEFSTI